MVDRILNNAYRVVVPGNQAVGARWQFSPKNYLNKVNIRFEIVLFAVLILGLLHSAFMALGQIGASLSWEIRTTYASETIASSAGSYLPRGGQPHQLPQMAIFDSGNDWGIRGFTTSSDEFSGAEKDSGANYSQAFQPMGSSSQDYLQVYQVGSNPLQNSFQLPIRGNVQIVGFGPGQSDHIGRDYWAVDLISDLPKVYPVAPGKVVYAAYNVQRASTKQTSAYGYVVAIDHGQGLYSVYAHLAGNGLPAVGSQVSWDTPIGIMSDSGCFGRCDDHLHFAIHKGNLGLSGEDALWLSNTPVNPYELISGLAVLRNGR